MTKSFQNIMNSAVAIALLKRCTDGFAYLFKKETLNDIAQKTFIEDIKKSELDPLNKAVIINNADKIIKEYSNKCNIIKKAIPLLTGKSKPDEIDEDWLNEFMDKARLVSDEEFQVIWAKILATEAENKNSISIRTLYKLKSLCKDDARAFINAGKLALGSNSHRFILANDSINERYGLPFDDVLLLEECGLMSAHSLTFNVIVPASGVTAFADNNNSDIVITNNGSAEFNFTSQVYTFTKSGKELLDALAVARDDTYIVDVMISLKELYCSNSKLNFTIIKHNVE